MNRSTPISAKLVLFVFGFLSISSVTLWVQYTDWNERNQIKEYGQISEATVIGCEGRGKGNTPYLSYRYEAVDLDGDKLSYESEDSTTSEICQAHPAGSEIEITYSKKNPRIAQIGTEVVVYPLVTDGIVIFLLFGIIFLLVVFGEIWVRRK